MLIKVGFVAYKLFDKFSKPGVLRGIRGKLQAQEATPAPPQRKTL